MFRLNEQSKASIERATGIPYNDILNMDIETIERIVEKKIGKKLKFTDDGLMDFDIAALDNYIDSLPIH